MITNYTISLEGDNGRESFLLLNNKKFNQTPLSFEDILEFSKVEYYDICNEDDVSFNEDGITEEYFEFIDVLTQHLGMGKYDNLLIENPTKNMYLISLSIQNFNTHILQKDLLNTPEKIDPINSCILHASKEIINDVAHRMQLLVNVLSKYLINYKIDEIKPPFLTDETNELFIYLNNNWVKKSISKYTYIFNYLVDELGLGSGVYKKDYENYISNCLARPIGRLQYDKTKSDSKSYVELRKIKLEYDKI